MRARRQRGVNTSRDDRVASSLILASASPTRARMLARAGLSMPSMTPNVDEQAIKQRGLTAGLAAAEIVQHLANAKAIAVAVDQPATARVIGADQALLCDGMWFDKAADMAGAAAVLGRLQGRRHQLISAVCVTKAGKPAFGHVARATLRMRPLTDADIVTYLQLAGPSVLSSVGCYQLEGPGVRLFEEIEGDFFTILGLPLLGLLRYLREEGVIDGSDHGKGMTERKADGRC